MSEHQSTRGRGRRGRGDTSLPSHPRGAGRGRSEGSALGGRGRGGGSQAGLTPFSHGPGDSAQPDLSVQKIENELAVKLTRTKTSPSAFAPRLPPRPGFGTRGREILLWTNHFELLAYRDMALHRYSIEIVPDQTGRRPAGKKVRRIVELLLEEHLFQYAANIATDFKSNLICRTELDIAEDGYDVVYRVEGEDDAPANAKRHRIRLTSTGVLMVPELLDELTSTNAGSLLGSREEIIQALNIVVGHHPKAASDIASIGSNRHYALNAAASERIPLGAGLAAVRGFFISVRAATGRLLANIQVKHGAFYEDGPLERVVAAHLASNGYNKIRLAKFISKLSISVTHIVRKNKAGRQIPRTKVIAGLATQNDGVNLPHPPVVAQYGAGPKEVKFWLGDSAEASSSVQSCGDAGSKGGRKAPKPGPKPPSHARYISVYDFFRSQHNIIVNDPSLPVVNVGTRERPSYLPAQVCLVIPGQSSNTQLSPVQTQQMIRFAVRKPALNAKSIITSGAQMLTIGNPSLTAFNVSITPRLITGPGRVLNSPNVKYGVEKLAPRFGSWDMRQV